MKKFYISTAIDYANGPPHLGHAYEKVLTDVVARSRRLLGEEVHFLTGLDEHGQKVQQSARREGVEPREFVDQIAEQFRALLRKLRISNDDFIRTTEVRHRVVVREFLQRLFDRGDIYRGEYSGFYSVRAEQFVLEREMIDGEWPEEYGEVIELSEENYFFRLSKYQRWLIEYIERHDEFIYPRFRAKQVIEFLKEPVNDLCISRPRERLSWGIPLPFDEDFVAYVWFDALINYISAIDPSSDSFCHYWPVNYHVIGKDILVPPHSVYWPIMLKAAGLDPPQGLLVHGFWTTSGKKMSKSTGEIVDPLDLIDRYGPDAFRYFVIREMTVGQDSEFTLERFLGRYTSDLANDFGNLVSRLLNMTHRYCQGVLPAARAEESLEAQLIEQWRETQTSVEELFLSFQFHTALERIFGFVGGMNRYAERRAPWKLAKSSVPSDRALLETSLASMAEGLRLAATALAPVMPGVSAEILGRLGCGAEVDWRVDLDWGNRLKGNRLGEKIILFPRHR